MGSSYDWNYTTEPSRPATATYRLPSRQGPRRIERHQRDGAHPRQSPASMRWRGSAIPDGATTICCQCSSGRAHARGQGDDPHAGHTAFLAAGVELGFRADARHDFNGPQPEGVAGFYRKNILNGRRHSTAAAFLAPALARRTSRSARRRRRRVWCSRGVESSASSICSTGRPRTGTRAARGRGLRGRRRFAEAVHASGIGAADDLRALGIPVVVDLPGVGANLRTIRSCRSGGGEDHAARIHSDRGAVRESSSRQCRSAVLCRPRDRSGR